MQRQLKYKSNGRGSFRIVDEAILQGHEPDILIIHDGQPKKLIGIRSTTSGRIENTLLETGVGSWYQIDSNSQLYQEGDSLYVYVKES